MEIVGNDRLLRNKEWIDGFEYFGRGFDRDGA